MAEEKASIKIELEGGIAEAIQGLKSDFASLSSRVDQLDDNVHDAFDHMEKGAKRANQSLHILAYGAISQIGDTFGRKFQDASQGVFDYDYNLRELQGITQVVDEDLDKISDSARQNAVDFGLDASESLRTYTLLLSKLSPEIAKNDEALAMMGRTNATLAQTMRGDSVGAVSVLSAAMNQYGVDLNDPIKAAQIMDQMSNQMAAAAIAGSAEVTDLAPAIEASGASASAAGVDFAEYLGALEVVSKFGKEGAEGGVAVRNVLGIMGRQDFIPERVREQLQGAGVDINVLADKSLTLEQRLAELSKIGDNSALLSGLFGAENEIAARGLLSSRDLLLQYTEEIRTNTTAAADLAATLGESYQETRNRITSYFDDIKLSIFGATGAMLPYIDVTISGALEMMSIMPGIMAMIEMYQMLASSQKLVGLATMFTTKVTWLWTGAQAALNAVMNMSLIGWIITGVGLLVAGVVWAWDTFEGFRASVWGVWEAVKQVFTNIGGFVMKMMKPFVDAVGFLLDGEWGKAAVALGEGMFNLATSQIQFIGDMVNSELTKGVGEAYAAGDAKGRASWKEDNPDTSADPSNPIVPTENSPAGVPGTPQPYDSMPFMATGGSTPSSSSSSSSGSSSSGGSKNITTTIQQLVGKIEINITNGGDMKNLESKIREVVNQALIGAVNDFEVMAGA